MTTAATPALILDFLDSLRAEIRLGPHQTLAIHELLLQLVRLNRIPEDPRELAEMVAPLVCSNDREQELFYRHLASWVAQRAGPPGTEAPLVTTALPRKSRWPRAVLAVVLGLVAVSMMVVYLLPTAGILEVPSGGTGSVRLHGIVTSQGRPVANASLWYLKQKTQTGEDGRFDVTPSPQPNGLVRLLITQNDFEARLDTIDPSGELTVELTPKSGRANLASFPGVPQPVVAVRPVSPLPAGWRRELILLAAAAPLILLLVLIVQRMRISKWSSPFEQPAHSIKVAAPLERLDPRDKIRRILQFLRRPYPLERTEIAAAATAIATARAAGYFSPRYLHARQSPAYLVAINQVSPRDQLAAYHEAMMQAVAQESGNRDLFEIRRVALSAPVLQRLSTLFPDRIVWAFAEPDAVRSPFGNGPAEWLRLLAQWPNQLLLSPLARFGWTETEWKRWGLDLAVAAPTLDGLLSWTSDRPRWTPHDQWQLGPYPPLLRDLPEMWLTGEAPEPRIVAQLRVQLRAYLGRDGFACLAACAIFPAFSWEATLNCVVRLVLPEDQPVGLPGSLAVLDPRASAILERLVRLPWLRHNRMPKWLREKLAEGLSPEDAAKAGKVLQELLARLAADRGDDTRLTSRILRRENTKSSRRKGSPRDYVLLSLFWRRFSDRLSLAAPNWFRRFRLRNGLFLRPMALPAALALLLSLGLGLLASRIPADSPTKINMLVRPAAAVQPTQAENPGTRPQNEFMARVLDVAASQVGKNNQRGEWDQPFVTWAFQQTAAIVAAPPVKVVAAATEEEQWTNAVKDRGVKVYPASRGSLPSIEPGFVFAHDDGAGRHVGIVESVANGHNLTTLEPSAGPGNASTIVRRYRDARNINVGFIDYARSNPGQPEVAPPPVPPVFTEPTLKVQPTELSFTYQLGGALPRPGVIEVRAGKTVWMVAARERWIRVSPEVVEGDGSIQVAVNPAGLTPGEYSGFATISGKGRSVSPVRVRIRLSVTEAAVPPKAAPPLSYQTRVNPADGLTYVFIPPGRFMMGCSPGDTECGSDEKKPPVPVQIADGFWLGQTEVTQAAWKKVMKGDNPSNFKGDQLPVEAVDWNQANTYCKAIGGRLPNEKEWEYAARAGTTGSRYGALDGVAWYGSNSGGKTHPVGLKQANAFGLYDMLGNVYEWTSDDYDAGRKVVRGGSWIYGAGYVRASYRGWDVPRNRFSSLGFRCVGEFR